MTVTLTGDDATRRHATAAAMPRPLTDTCRLLAVAGLLADPDPLDDLDLTLLSANVAEAAGAGTALISLVLNDVTVIVAGTTVPEPVAEGGGMPVEWTPCGVVAGSDRAVVIADLTADLVYGDTPLTLACGLRSYAGVPLRNADGLVIGTLAVLDATPDAFDHRLLPRLTAAAEEILPLLERRAR